MFKLLGIIPTKYTYNTRIENDAKAKLFCLYFVYNSKNLKYKGFRNQRLDCPSTTSIRIYMSCGVIANLLIKYFFLNFNIKKHELFNAKANFSFLKAYKL